MSAALDHFEYNPETGILKRFGRELTATDGKGRKYVSFEGRPIQATRIIWKLQTGNWPRDGYVIDHINNDSSDDRWINLQEITYSQNIHKAKSRGYQKIGKKYYVRVTINDIVHHIGAYDSVKKAIKERRKFLAPHMEGVVNW